MSLYLCRDGSVVTVGQVVTFVNFYVGFFDKFHRIGRFGGLYRDLGGVVEPCHVPVDPRLILKFLGIAPLCAIRFTHYSRALSVCFWTLYIVNKFTQFQ